MCKNVTQIDKTITKTKRRKYNIQMFKIQKRQCKYLKYLLLSSNHRNASENIRLNFCL